MPVVRALRVVEMQLTTAVIRQERDDETAAPGDTEEKISTSTPFSSNTSRGAAPCVADAIPPSASDPSPQKAQPSGPAQHISRRSIAICARRGIPNRERTVRPSGTTKAVPNSTPKIIPITPRISKPPCSEGRTTRRIGRLWAGTFRESRSMSVPKKPDGSWHLTLNTGHTRKSYRSEVEDSTLVRL